MLKIKDNIDLKVLEKFGFVKNLRKQRYERTFNGYLGSIETTHININTNEVTVFKKSIMGIEYIENSFEIEYFTQNTDLIKADMVEKVVEDENHNN